MRRYLLSMTVAVFFALPAVPMTAGAFAEPPRPGAETEQEAVQPVNVADTRPVLWSAGLRDEAAMVLAGMALIALAAAVRRTA